MALLGSSSYAPGSTNANYYAGSAYGPPSAGPAGPQGAPQRQAYTDPYAGLGQTLSGLYSGASSLPGLQAAPQIGNGYTSYLNQARSRISQDLAQSLGDISASEQRGSQVINQIPAQLQQIYGGSQQQLASEVQAEQSAQRAAGLQSFQDKNGASTAGSGPILAGQGGVAPVAAAMQADQSSRSADVPLLQLGNSQLAQQQRGRAQMTAADLYNQNDLEGAQLANQNAIAQAQLSGQFAASNNDFLRNAYLQGQGLQGQAALAGAQYQAQLNPALPQNQYYEGLGQYYANQGANQQQPPFTMQLAQAASQIPASEANSVRSSSIYKNAFKSIKSDGSNAAQVIRDQYQQGHQRTAQLLAQLYS